MRVEDFSDAAVTAALNKLLAQLLNGIIDMDDQTQRDLLEAITIALDDLDGDDAFGTEGWEHRYGFED
jgi:hypothetical protein